MNKRLHVLDNRLDNAMVKYNEALANNKSLREKTNAARRQRMVYDNIYTKLEAELKKRSARWQRSSQSRMSPTKTETSQNRCRS